MFGKQRVRSAVLAAFLCIGTLAGGGSALAQGAKTPLRVAYTPAVPWLSIWVAKDTGIFDRNGLDVIFTQVQNLSLLPATLGKQIDVAPTTPTDIVKTAASGLDVVGITGGTLEVAENRAVELIVRKDSSIKTAQDLKGKLIAAPTIGAIMHVSTLYWLKKNGVDPNSVRAVEVPFPNMGDQLRAGRVDAAEVIQPFAGALMANGGVSIADPILEIADRTMVTLWIAEGNWARSNPATLAKWNASVAQAVDFIKTKPAEARAILAKYTKLPEAVVQKLPVPDFDTTLTPAKLDIWIKVVRELGQISGDLDAARMVVTAK